MVYCNITNTFVAYNSQENYINNHIIQQHSFPTRVIMKSKKMRFSCILSMLAIGGIFIISGCDDAKDLYNPDRIQEEAKEAFPVKDIDPNQTWETSAVCKASVSVNEKAGETYTIKVYTANPYNTDGDAALLATATVENGKTANFKFDIPAALQYVYVMKVNGEGYSSAMPVAVESNAIKVTFGEGAATTRAAATRANGSFFTPEIPGEKLFPTEAPADCKEQSSEKFEGGGNFLLENKTYGNLQIENGGNFYIKGNVTINNWNSPKQAINFYILPNATLTLGMGEFNHRENSIFSIGSGATLNAGERKIGLEKNSQFFNKGNIKAKHITVRSNAYLYNIGNLTAEELTIDVEGAKVCNATDGRMSITSNFKISNGHFLNEDGATADIKTTSISGNSATSSWENAGHYTATDISITSHNEKVKNSCKLEIKDKLIIESGTLLNEGYIESKDLDMSNGLVKMASGSYINVTEEAKFQDSWENDNSEGFVATGSWAILKMTKAKYKAAYHAIAYIGKLYIACDDHFSIGNQWNPTYKLDGAQMTGADNAPISIPTSGCNPGYNSTPDGGGTDIEPAAYAYAFEDMMKDVGDYDFNDVVLYVTVPYDKDGQKVVDVTLKAAGASKQLAVLFNNSGKDQTVFANVHEALGVSVGTIVNTGAATGNAKTKTIEVGSDFNLTEDGDFYISDGQREIHIPEFTKDFQAGNAPYALRVASSTWKWPKERILITDAYTGFAKWAQNATEEPNWYDNPVSGKVMN